MALAKRLISTYKQQSILPGWLALLMILLSLINLARVFQPPLSADRSIDFRPLYLGQYRLQQGEDPYDYERLIQTWKEIAVREDLDPKSVPRFLLYPPWALALFLVFAPLPFGTAVWIWYAALPIMLTMIIYCSTKFFIPSPSWVNFVEAGIFALASKGTVQSMTVGQPAFLCLALGFGSLLLYGRRRDLLAGLLLGLAALKISLAVPFILFFAFRRKLITLVAAAGMGAALTSVWFVLTDDPLEVGASYLTALRTIDRYSYRPDRSGYPLTYDMINKTEIGALAEYLVNGIAPYLPILHLFLFAMVVIFCARILKGNRPTDLFLFLLLSLVALMTTHHFYYDCLILLPLYAFALQLKPSHRRLLMLLLWAFYVPVNGLLNRLPTPPIMDVFYFMTPVTIAALMVFFLWRLAEGDESLDTPITIGL